MIRNNKRRINKIKNKNRQHFLKKTIRYLNKRIQKMNAAIYFDYIISFFIIFFGILIIPHVKDNYRNLNRNIITSNE